MFRAMIRGCLAEISAVDAFALSMFGVIALAMGTIALLFLCMRREASRRDPQVDALLEEIERDERDERRRTCAEPARVAREPWERNPDWWRNGPA